MRQLTRVDYLRAIIAAAYVVALARLGPPGLLLAAFTWWLPLLVGRGR